MKITGLKPIIVFNGNWNWTFVKVYTDEGITGVGEASVESKGHTVAEAVKELEPYLIGKEPFGIEEHWQNMFYRTSYYSGGPILQSAIAGVEMALWDIVGKSLGVPVYKLLGGPCRDKVRTYANFWWGKARTVEDYARAARETVARGFTGLKWDPFGDADRWEVSARTAKQAVECVAAVREAVGDDVNLMIEVHGRLNPDWAIRLAKELEPFKPYWYEEPVPAENTDALSKVAREINIPIATGERLYSKWDFRVLFESQAADIVQPDPVHTGGITEMKKIAAMAEACYVPVAPHNPNGPVCTAVVLQLAACIPNVTLLESFVSYYSLCEELTGQPVVLEDGCFRIPDKPGLGVEIDEEVAARHPYQHYDQSRMFSRQWTFQDS